MIPVNLAAWATRWNLPPQAFAELRVALAPLVDPPGPPDSRAAKAEAYVQSQVRLEAAQKDVRLWRNNVGVLKDRTGRPVRYGLANDSEALNEKLKSSDLIGWRPVTITPGHVGQVIAQTVARECKAADWKFTGTDREVAQQTWIHLLQADGGDAAFTTGPGSL